MAQLNLTLTPEDIGTIRRLAREQGCSVSAYVRALALGEVPASDRLSELEDGLRSVSQQLGDLKSQIVGFPDPAYEIEQLDRRLSAVEELARQSYR
jgi:hypothetical protein